MAVAQLSRLAAMIADAEQVLITAAVASDVPSSLAGRRYVVADGAVTRDDASEEGHEDPAPASDEAKAAGDD